jgi:hypothetical protein
VKRLEIRVPKTPPNTIPKHKQDADRDSAGLKGKCKHAGAPDRLCTVFLRGPIHHWNCDRGCEPAQLTGIKRLSGLGWGK